MQESVRIPVIETGGTPYEIGRGHGEQGKQQVLACLKTYQGMFKAYSDINWPDAREMSRGFIEPIRRYDPDYLEEIRGVADGAGVMVEDILALNVRSELVLQGKPAEIHDGCTSISVSADRGQNGHVLLGQNWDWRGSQRDAVVLLKIHQTNGKPDIFMLTEAGIIGKFGFNSCGIGICMNALAVDAPPSGVPLHIAMRGVLDSQNLCAALTNASRMGLACAANFMLASGAAGEVVDIELTNNDFDILYPPYGAMAHTNHFLSPRLPEPPFHDVSKHNWLGSFIRYGVADRKLRAIRRPIGISDMKMIFSDHSDFPTSICHHEDPNNPEAKRMCTVLSFVMDLTDKKFYLCMGYPCEAEYAVYSW